MIKKKKRIPLFLFTSLAAGPDTAKNEVSVTSDANSTQLWYFINWKVKKKTRAEFKRVQRHHI